MTVGCHCLGWEGGVGSSWNVLGCMELIQGCLGCCMGLILKDLQVCVSSWDILEGTEFILGCFWGCVQGLSGDVLWEYEVSPGLS